MIYNKEPKARERRLRRKLKQLYTVNKHFPNSNKHHIDRETIIFIPIKLHRSIPHNIWNGNNMDRINELALEWFWNELQLPNQIDISNIME